MRDPPETDRLVLDYLLDELENAERAALEEALRTDPTLRRRLRLWQDRLGALAAALPPKDAPEDGWPALEAALRALPAGEATPAADGGPASKGDRRAVEFGDEG